MFSVVVAENDPNTCTQISTALKLKCFLTKTGLQTRIVDFDPKQAAVRTLVSY